jgi:hypothetical protein
MTPHPVAQNFGVVPGPNRHHSLICAARVELMSARPIYCPLMQGIEGKEGRTRVDANFEIPLGWLRNASFASSPSNAKGDENLCGSFDSTDMLTRKMVAGRLVLGWTIYR